MAKMSELSVPSKRVDGVQLWVERREYREPVGFQYPLSGSMECNWHDGSGAGVDDLLSVPSKRVDGVQPTSRRTARATTAHLSVPSKRVDGVQLGRGPRIVGRQRDLSVPSKRVDGVQPSTSTTTWRYCATFQYPLSGSMECNSVAARDSQ